MKIFKEYDQNVQYLIPPSLEDLIPKDHIVIFINKVVEGLDLTNLLKKYKGGGRTSYHPGMLLKILFYAYINNIFSSRKIEQMVQENINFMYLSGMQKPDHNTIARFRSKRLEGTIHDIFISLTNILIEKGYVSIKELYVDGTKLEANANKYSFVWGKTIKYNKRRITEQLEELWNYACKIAKEEMESKTKPDTINIKGDDVKKIIAEINESIKDKPVDKSIKQKLNYAGKNWPNNLDKYEKQEELIGTRNSMSKIDNDATFMKMKEDYMHNGQLKPGYNIQLGVNNQVILEYGIYPNPTDTTTLPSFIEQVKETYKETPEKVIADAGYGSEENYEYLEKNKIEGLVKYNTFDKEIKNKKNKNSFNADNLHYNEKENYYVCPMGQHMNFISKRKRVTDNGYEQEYSLYQANNCTNCPLLGVCHKQKTNRIISVNHNLKKFRAKAKELLQSEQGDKLRRRRKIEVEPVFGNIKQNKGFKRFMLRGEVKVNIEFGLISIVHNLSKLFKFINAEVQTV